MKIALACTRKTQTAFWIVFLMMLWVGSVANASSLSSCFMDLDGDKVVDGNDMAEFIQQYEANNCTGGCNADYNGNGVVDETDLAEFAEEFGRVDCVDLSSHQAAIVGPLSNTEIAAYQITALSQPAEGPINAAQSNDLQTAGSFDLALSGVADDDWIVVSATGGEDIDHDGDGIVDPLATTSLGTIHAIAKAGDWRNKNLRVTPLTELAYRFSEHLFSEIPQEDLAIRLADLARNLIKTDIDGNGSVDWYDILAFDPANPAHRDKLSTSYDWLSTVNEEGYSILASLLAGDETQMLSCMDDTYSYLMTRFPVPDSRYHSVKITLSVFGAGSATSNAPYSLAVDSTLTEPLLEDHIYLPVDESSLVTFTAAAAPDSQILSWSGCETVSADLSQCTVPLNKSQSVVINFGQTDTLLTGELHDLRNTNNFVYANSISVLIPNDMTDMIAEMASASVDDFIVGDDGGGFLRRITAINQISATNYQLGHCGSYPGRGHPAGDWTSIQADG